MTWFLIGIVFGIALLTLIAFIDSKIKKKKLKKLMESSFKESCETYGFNIPNFKKGDK
jgi:hypothetical protein